MTTNIYNPNDGINGRTGGPYLDQQQQVEQERLNAFREGREPDYDNLPLTPGIPGVSARKLVENYNSTALDGDHARDSVEINAPVLARIDESALSENSSDDEEEKSAKEKRAETSKQKSEDAATKEANRKAAAGKTVTDASTEKSSQHAPAEKAETSKTPNDDGEIKID